MRIDSSARIAHQIERVYPTYRNELPALAAYLPDISRIEVMSRQEREGGVDLLNVWYASTPVPAVASAILRPDMLRWEDHAEWDDAANLARWRLVVPAFRDQVSCEGETRIIADGAYTTVALVGELHIDLARFPGVNRLVARAMKPRIEAFIGRLIAPNMRRVNGALEQYLDDTYG